MSNDEIVQELPKPIEVAATPVKSQTAAAVRQAALAVGVIAAAFGASGIAAKANIVVSLAPQIAELLVIFGPVVAGAAVWLGQLSTRKHAKTAAVLVDYAPDEVAVKK